MTSFSSKHHWSRHECCCSDITATALCCVSLSLIMIVTNTFDYRAGQHPYHYCVNIHCSSFDDFAHSRQSVPDFQTSRFAVGMRPTDRACSTTVDAEMLKCYDVGDWRRKRHRRADRHARLGCSVICINGPSTPVNGSWSRSSMPPSSRDW